LDQNVAENANSVSANLESNPTSMQKAWSGWFQSTRKFNGGPYQEKMTFNYKGLYGYVGHNVARALECPNGYQTINAHIPVDGYNWFYMDVRCYKPVGGTACIPYPKFRLDFNKNTDDFRSLYSTVYSSVPPITHGAGWPSKNRPATADYRQFNTAFDIYFQKNNPAYQTLSNYCVVMVWLNWEGMIGPAGEIIDDVWVDGVHYWVAARTKFANNDFIINYCRVDKATNVNKVNVLAIINHIKQKRYLGCELRNTKLTNYNLGFEIFNANGHESNQKFAINQYNTYFD